MVADNAGPTAAFALAAGAGVLALLTVSLRSRTLVCREPERPLVVARIELAAA